VHKGIPDGMYPTPRFFLLLILLKDTIFSHDIVRWFSFDATTLTPSIVPTKESLIKLLGATISKPPSDLESENCRRFALSYLKSSQTSSQASEIVE
jgi:hypothetical protein